MAQLKRTKLIHHQQAKGNVLLIYTGGTFGMMRNTAGSLVPFDFSNMVDHLPTIKNLSLNIDVIEFEKPIDSANINPEHWKLMADVIEINYHDFDGFVILHGTDTMAFSASALSFMLEGLSKPVILTGAQLPISEPRSDARENLITAIEIAAAKDNGKPIVPEVAIFFDYELLRGNRSKKVESMQFDAFDSGNYPALAKAGVKIDFNRGAIFSKQNKFLKVRMNFDASIALIKLYPGISSAYLQAVVNTRGLKALIIETYGSGNAPTDSYLLATLSEAVKKGIIVLNISQCQGGRVTQGKYETSKALEEIGVIGGLDLTTEAAVTKLMYLLGNFSFEEVKTKIIQNLAGELTI
ncbi:MAG: asparaginase [Chryseotalea sp.]|jgi:L-asparaginase